ncbi:MAG: hypothetical protein ACR2NF_08960 [Pirellulales bacterium]
MRLKQGQAAKLRFKDVTGRFKTPDEKAASLFMDGETSLQDFKAAVGSRPLAQEALSEALKLDLYESVVDVSTGRIVPNRLKAWTAKRQAALDAFPELRSQLKQAGSAQKVADDLRKQSEQIAKNPEQFGRALGGREFMDLDDAERSVLAVTDVVKRSKAENDKSVANLFLGEDSDRAAERLIRSQTPTARVSTMMKKVEGDPGAMRGLQRSLWDAALSKFESRAVDALNRPVLQARVMREFILDNKPWMTKIFGEERVRRLDVAQQALAKLEVTGRPVRPGGSDTAINLESGIRDFGPLLSRLYAHQRGIVSLKWVLSERAARNLRSYLGDVSERQATALLQEAFFNPKVASDLIDLAQAGKSTQVVKRLQGHLLNMNLDKESEP